MTSTTPKAAAMVLAMRLGTYAKKGLDTNEIVSEFLKLIPETSSEFDSVPQKVVIKKKNSDGSGKKPKASTKPEESKKPEMSKKPRGRPRKVRSQEELQKMAAEEKARSERKIARAAKKAEEVAKPKRPANSYMTWLQATRGKILKQMESDGVEKEHLRSVAGQMWKKMSDKKKAPWVEDARARLDKWKAAMTLYEFSVSN